MIHPKSFLSRPSLVRLWLNLFYKALQRNSWWRTSCVCIEKTTRNVRFSIPRLSKFNSNLFSGFGGPLFYSLLCILDELLSVILWPGGWCRMTFALLPLVWINTLKCLLGGSAATLSCKVDGMFWPNWLLSCWGCIQSGVPVWLGDLLFM